MFHKPEPKPEKTDRGIHLVPGDRHYRAYVGPPADYDVVAAMCFNLLTVLGMRDIHRVLDVGCGSLRVGRLLIPFLNSGNYVGVEPNKWLVDDGVEREIGEDQIGIKRPTFSLQTDMRDFQQPLDCQFALAQSIFSHCGQDLLRSWLEQLQFHLAQDGALAATFILGDEDTVEEGWVYPGCVTYRPQSINTLCTEIGLHIDWLDWYHPRQSWALISAEGFDRDRIMSGPLTWNRLHP